MKKETAPKVQNLGKHCSFRKCGWR
jgi:hypothetical protein